MPLLQIQFVKLVFAGMLLFWTLAAIAAFFMAEAYIQQSKFGIVESMARMSLQKDVAYRHLFASLDRIYVPRQPGVEANPFLNFTQKELVTREGEHLIQLNPAYLTRLFYKMDSQASANTRASLVSLRPVNPQNAPDQWQEDALKSFRKGKQEASTIQEKGNGWQLRLMQPLKVSQDCLRCHAKQGYEVGDIRGGISLSMPLSYYEESLQKDRMILVLGLGLVWLVGALGIGSLGRQFTHRVHEHDQYSARLQHLSLHDPLTGLYNRFAFDHEMERLHKGRYDSICIIVCDVDGLKEVNDEQGHVQGDRLIISAAQNIAVCLREGDLVARIGGDEFAVLLTNTADQECGKIVQRIRSKIEQFNRNGGDPQLSLSVGYALWNVEEPRDLQSIF